MDTGYEHTEIPSPHDTKRERQVKDWRAFWCSLLYWLGMVCATLIIAPPGILSFPFPLLWRYRVIVTWTRFNMWWLKCSCGLDYRVVGVEHLPEGPAIVLCKHQSTWETFALTRILPPQVWVLKRELLRIPFFGWALAMLEPIAIDRRLGRQVVPKILEQGAKRLAEGRWVVVFPEGTRVAPGQKGRYGIGGALLAEHTGYPVVPIAHNAGEFWPRHAFVKRAGTIRVVIGPVIDPRGLSAREINARVEAWIEDAMRKISSRVKSE
jgi:1-acyl-sn-glycerol-3-phosphate acyltransferase